MDAIFADMIYDNLVIIYMDNIFIYAPDEETLEHQESFGETMR